MDQEERIKVYNITEEIKGYQKEIAKLKEENKQLEEKVNEYSFKLSNFRCEETYEREIKQLKDNWNKLKEYCKENLYFYSGIQKEDLEIDNSIQDILNKMQELEKSDK